MSANKLTKGRPWVEDGDEMDDEEYDEDEEGTEYMGEEWRVNISRKVGCCRCRSTPGVVQVQVHPGVVQLQPAFTVLA